MLTHDIEPAIDVIKSTAKVFEGSHPSATFLSSRAGIVTEVPIKSSDIHTFAKICTEIVNAPGDNLIKSIYLRRFYEIMDNAGLEYNLLASLFKKRAVPTIQSATENRDMTAAEKLAAETEIRNRIPDFDYDALVGVVNDDAVMKAKFAATNVGYEKIQLFRIIRGKHEDNVITKFINESYHIENEYVMQLNPHKFESVPEYVVEECMRLLDAA
jgi:hypothetical protein